MIQQARAGGKPFQLLVTDLQMPEIDGVTLVSELRQDPDLAGLPAIMLTSGDNTGDSARCRELGIGARLLKPIKQSELFDAVVSVLGITAPEDAGLESPELIAEVPLEPLKILLAEDSLVNQRLAVALLEKHGHQVVVANNGVEAVEAVSRQFFDLVLMDVQMPEMDGFAATQAIRKDQARTGRHIPIVAMTAHALRGDRERCIEAGMDGYVAKPIHAKILFQTMKLVLETARSE
jgi:two-component system, sensor histidine kinase and response regulator